MEYVAGSCCCCRSLLCCMVVVWSLVALGGCQESDQVPTGSTQTSGLGSTQIYQPPPISPSTCYYFDSRTNASRECPLTSSCFSFIRRTDDQGGYRIKRGCRTNCQDENRNRKVQICCSTHLCNNHTLSPANFSNIATPPPAMPTFITPTSHTPSEPSSSHSTSTPSTTPSTYMPPILSPNTPSGGPLTCHCSSCHGGTCLGTACANRIAYTDRPVPMETQVCVQNRADCTPAISNPDPQPGTVHLHCCRRNLCNVPLIIVPTPPLTPTTSDATPTDTPTMPGTTIPTSATSTVVEDLETTTDATPPSPVTPVSTTITIATAPTSTTPTSDQLYFTLTTVVSILGGLVLLGVVLVLLTMLVIHIRKARRSKVTESGGSSRASSISLRAVPSDTKLISYHLQPPPGKRESPPLSSSTSSSSSASSSDHINLHLDLKHLGTSV